MLAWVENMQWSRDQDNSVDDGDAYQVIEVERGLVTCKHLIDELDGTIELFQDCEAQKTIIQVLIPMGSCEEDYKS